MKGIEIKRLVTGIIILGIIVAIRIAFFAVDGSMTTMDVTLKVLVFLGSIGLILYVIWLKRNMLRSWIKTPGEKRWFVIFLVVIELTFLLKTGISPSSIYWFSVILSITLITTVSLLLPPRGSKIFDIIVMIIYACYVLGQDTYYRIFNDFFSAREIVSAREGFESSESMYKFEFYQVFVLVFLASVLYLYVREKRISHLRFHHHLLFFPLFIVTIIQLNSHYPKSIERIYTSDHYVYQTLYHKETFIQHFGTLHLVFRDLTDSIIPPLLSVRDVDYLDHYYETLDKSFDYHDRVGLFEGKNLIYILAESYDEIALSEALTPHLYQLKIEGIDFQSHFTPVYQRTTSDTEFIINTSQIPSIEDGPTSGIFRYNSYRTSMAYLFSQIGYQTHAFHANYKEFYGRHILYEGYGYQQFFGQHELGLSDQNKRFDTAFYASMKSHIASANQPFMSMMITFSGHSPYTKNNEPSMAHFDSVDAYYGNTIPLEVKHYIATQIELDIMIGELLDDLEAWGLLDDTVIMLSGDHYPYTMNQTDYESISGINEYHMKQQGNLYIWAQGIEAYDVDHLSSSFDILPMVIQLFGLPGTADFYVGNDILGGSETLVFFKNYTVYNGSRLIRMNDRNEPNIAILKHAYHAYRVSRSVLRVDYFKI